MKRGSGPGFETLLWAYAAGDRSDELTLGYVFSTGRPGEHTDVRFRLGVRQDWGAQATFGDVPPEAVRQAEDGHVVSFERTLPGDTVQVEVQVRWGPRQPDEHDRPPGHADATHFLQTVPLNPPDITPLTVPRVDAPRLVTALNGARLLRPEERPDWPGTFDSLRAQVEHLLTVIFDRLERGLEPFWDAAYVAAGRMPPTPMAVRASLDERWARLTSELFVGAPYAGCGMAMFGSHGKDWAVFDRFAGKTPGREDDPAFPLTLACQHSCQVGAIAAGYALMDGWDPVNKRRGLLFQGSIGNDFIVRSLGGQWILPGALPPPIKGDTPGWLTRSQLAWLIQEKGLGPCSVVCGYPSDLSIKAGQHIAHALRVHPARSTFQFFDVGGMSTTGREGPDVVELGLVRGVSRCYDDPFSFDRVQGSGGAAVLQGVGILPRLKRDVVRAALERTARAWPMGFARLVLLRRGDEDPGQRLLYATPLLRMHTEVPHESFSIARLLASLRETPFADTIEAVWQVDLPRLTMAAAVLASARTDLVADLLAAGLGKPVPDLPDQPGPGHVLPMLDLTHTPGGQVRVVKRVEATLNDDKFAVVDAGERRSRGLKARLSWREARGALVEEHGAAVALPPLLRRLLALVAPSAPTAAPEGGVATSTAGR